MFQGVETAFRQYLIGFYQSLVPTTKYLDEYVARGADKSIAWAPSRLVDKAEEMLAAWQRNDTYPGDTKPYQLPVMIAGMSRDYVPTPRDFARQTADPVFAIIPNDPKERLFKIKKLHADIRAQVAIFAPEIQTAKSIAAQLDLFLDSVEHRRFFWTHEFAGTANDWPVQIETPEVLISSVETGNNNLVILVADLTLRTTVPIVTAPKPGEPNDGKGVPGTDDPAGYPVVIQVDSVNQVTGFEASVRSN